MIKKNLLKLTSFLYKFKKLFFLLKRTKIVLEDPKIKKIIIFDKLSSFPISKLLKINEYSFLSNRVEEIDKIYISKRIFFFLLKNFFNRSLKLNYLLSLIKIINPNVVITLTDTSIDFHLLSKILQKKINFISLQQGNRFFPNRNLAFDPDVSSKSINEYYIPEFYVFSKLDKKNFKSSEAEIKDYKIVGSLKASLALNFYKKKKVKEKKIIYDFCLISDPDYRSPTGIIANYIKKMSIENGLTYVIAGDTDLSDGSEINYYKKFLKTTNINIVKNNPRLFSSYLTMLRSKVILGYMSTMLREALQLNKKVLGINSFFKNIANLNILTKNSKNNNITWSENKNSFEKFKKRSLKILKMSNSDYFKTFKNSDYFMPRNIDTAKIIKQTILNYKN